MVQSVSKIDIREGNLSRVGKLLDLLLVDRTTGKNIIWATDSYEKYGSRFTWDKQITSSLITGNYEKIIQPRAIKSIADQNKRTDRKSTRLNSSH